MRFGASKPAVKEKERDIPRIERWETGDYMYRRQMEGRSINDRRDTMQSVSRWTAERCGASERIVVHR